MESFICWSQNSTDEAFDKASEAKKEITPRRTLPSGVSNIAELVLQLISSSPGAVFMTMAVTFAGTRPASRFVCQLSGSRMSETLGGSLRVAKTSFQVTLSSIDNCMPTTASADVFPSSEPWPV